MPPMPTRFSTRRVWHGFEYSAAFVLREFDLGVRTIGISLGGGERILGVALFDRGEKIREHFSAGLCAEVTPAVDTDADSVSFHVAVTDDEHRVDFHLLGTGDLGFDVVAARVELGADFVGAQLVLNGARVFEERRFIADWEDADLFWREPEREVARVMLDQETDETFVCA